jgi:hypothetical protein
MNLELHTKLGIKNMLEYRNEPECRRVFADLYWHVLLYVASIIMIVAIFFGVWELSAVLRGWETANAGFVGGARPVPALNKTQLQDTLEKFQSRARRFESLKASSPEVADPSQ